MSPFLRFIIGLGIMLAAGYLYQNHMDEIMAAIESSEDYDDSDYDPDDYEDDRRLRL